jgi:hypothetical protein
MTIYPTYLYIKQHSITKKKYFGKTTQDPLKYNGSGVYWTDHIKKHGRKHVITTRLFGPFTDSIVISEFALAFSRDNNIVESKDWANLEPENGLDGGVTGKPSLLKGKPSPLKGRPSPKKGRPSGPSPRKGIPTGPNGRKGISTGPSPKKGIPTGKPAWNKGISTGPNGRKGIPTGPSGRKGIPTGKPAWNKGISTGPSPLKGRPSPLKGRPSGPSPRKGIPTGPSGKQKNPAAEVECPHCGLVSRGGNMTRHHFDNCKMKPDLS